MNEMAMRIVNALRVECGERTCTACPCDDWCSGREVNCLENDAADLIESLSAQLDNQEAAIDRIYKQCIELQRNLKELGFNSIAEMYAQLDQVTRERGAAVEDMKIIRSCRQCKTWQEYFKDNGDVSPCEDCDMYSNWQWRGVEVEG